MNGKVTCLDPRKSIRKSIQKSANHVCSVPLPIEHSTCGAFKTHRVLSKDSEV